MLINSEQFPKIELPYDKILARLGYAAGKTSMDIKTQDLIHECVDLSKKLITPRQAVACSEVKITEPGKVFLEPGLTIVSQKIFELLKDCPAAYGFAVTIGPHLEDKRNQFLNIKETARALILDAIGSTATEELAEMTQNQIAELAAKQQQAATRRFSPGYGDWKIQDQKDFLRWIGAERIGIRLTPTSQMLPEKSVSAILGIK
jgi:hypothetical protein